jgi:dCMP deaminase
MNSENNNKRPSWPEYFCNIVKLTAQRSSCNKLHVGCLLIFNNRIVSQGYNGHLPNCPHESIIENDHEIATLHAEQNAVLDCAKRGVSCNNCIAYITHFPCITCAKFLLAAGIKKIYYINDYKNSDIVNQFCLQMKCPLIKVDQMNANNTINILSDIDGYP